MGKLMEDKGYLNKIFWCKTNSVPPLFPVIMVAFLFLLSERGEETPSQRRILSAFRQMGVGGQKYLYLLPCFQFRIIFMPKWHFLISFTGIYSIKGKQVR